MTEEITESPGDKHKKKRKCIICGKEFEPKWVELVCSESCAIVYSAHADEINAYEEIEEVV